MSSAEPVRKGRAESWKIGASPASAPVKASAASGFPWPTAAGILAERRPSGASKAGRTLRMPCASRFTVSAKKAIPSPGMAVAGYSVAMPHSAVPARTGWAAKPSSGAMAIRARRVVM